MEWKKEKIKGLLLVVCGGVAFYCLLQNLGTVAAALQWTVNLLSPFLVGGVFAFILNVPMRSIERILFPKKKEFNRVRRPLALILTLLAVAAVIGLASNVIIPGTVEAVTSVVGQLPAAGERLQAWLVQLEEYLPVVESFIIDLDIEWKDVSQKLLQLVQTWGSGLLSSGGGFIGDVVSAVSGFLIALVFAFYILLQKERLGAQGLQVLYALLPERAADRVREIFRLSDRTFSGFLSGQCLEACILGAMFVVAMTLFRMPYALLVGVLIALTALIPIVGAFIGCGVGALLIAITDPLQALLFIVMSLVLQQIEGNLIYPHVVGNSVGLPSIWVLVAVMLGGRLMGVAGMLVFIPICSVVYALFRGYVKQKLTDRKIPASKWTDAPPADEPPANEPETK
ncbi:MAG: AI-2E family transporter [Ruminococcaceae bacterium]|nr:AI-2E family transporter [Oscillospiraceae bacterium]